MLLAWGMGRDILPGILGGGVPHGSQDPDPISDQNIPFSIPFFRPDPEMKRSFTTLSNPDFSLWFVLFLNLIQIISVPLVNVQIVNAHVWSHTSLSKSYPISD